MFLFFLNGSEFRQKLIGTLIRVLVWHLRAYSGIKQWKRPLWGVLSHQSPGPPLDLEGCTLVISLAKAHLNEPIFSSSLKQTTWSTSLQFLRLHHLKYFTFAQIEVLKLDSSCRIIPICKLLNSPKLKNLICLAGLRLAQISSCLIVVSNSISFHFILSFVIYHCTL